jgi:diguanylate cyclase (GGDEF)-like protein
VPLRNEQNQIVGIVGISRNVTDRKSAEEQIRFMALHDALTKLPNRTLLMDRLAQIILHAERDRGHVTVIFIDLDNFKLVNDSLGHNAGDTLLKTVAERMVACVRATDTVARLGGDEFVVLLADHGGQQSFPTALLEKLRAAIAEPIPIEGQQFHVTSSIGVATFPEDGADADALVMNADVAMYEAKQKGRDNYQFYTGEMNEAARERRLLQEGLRGAIVNKEFVLAYQPQVDLHTGAIFAVEALVRWRHPMFGMVPPAKFIPLAEESGLIGPLGDWVMREACRQNKAWQDAGIPPITMCVNVSARQFRDRSWVARVTDVLRETGMDPNYLELELTESMLMHDVDTAIDTMRQLQATGVRFSIDDFGTGYSSLSALKSFPVARLKIDQSFVRNLPDDANDRSIAMAVISLGQKLNMKVIAEGVETDEQLKFLQNNDCDAIQGFHFSRPIDPDALAAMLQKQAAAA